MKRCEALKLVYSAIQKATKLIELAETYTVDSGCQKFNLEQLAMNELEIAKRLLESLKGHF